jgi:hypothetical protein
MGKFETWLGGLLFALPFVLFYGIFAFWPLGIGASVEASTREVLALTQQVEAGKAAQATAAKELADAGTDVQKKTAAEGAVKKADDNVSALSGKLAEAREELDAAFQSTAATKLPLLSDEARLCLLVVLAGALGASISAARGFAVHHGNKSYDIAWRWWYFLRIPTGCGIAFVLYAVLRAGLVPWQMDNESRALDTINPFGFVAIGALAGLFANETFQKLQEILAAIWSPGSKAQAPKPVIDGVKAAEDRKTITITGKNFTAGATVKVDGKDWVAAAKDISKTEIKATGPDEVARGTKVEVKVTIPGPPSQSDEWKDVVP